jgi:hypothetical protein
MEQIVIDLNETVYALCTKHPDLIGILGALGFTDITKPGMLQSAGRFISPIKGAALKRIPLEQIVSSLAEHGYAANT